MKKYLFLLLFLFQLASVRSQVVVDLAVPSMKLSKAEKSAIPQIAFDGIDLKSVLFEDSLDALDKRIPPRFGIVREVEIDIIKDGSINYGQSWTQYQLILESKEAKSINLNFNNFHLPSGSRAYIKSQDSKDIIGALGEHNNKVDGQFSTRPVTGSSILIEVYVPKGSEKQLKFQISQVVHGYKELYSKSKRGFNSSGSCNVNVNCPEVDIWQDLKRSVVMILLSDNSRRCSGTLINNVREDSTPYILTAEHCPTDNNSIFVFGYENSSPNCQISADGNLNKSISGAFLRASNAFSDFELYELSTKPPASYNVYYAGWDASGQAPVTSTTMHHPNGDIMKFSQDYDTATSSAYSPPNNNTHWRIGSWNVGTTEGGSSGSALFDQNKRIVGQLEGGSANCARDLDDYFGKLSLSYGYSSAVNEQLQAWLDPDTTNTLFIDGFDPHPKSNNHDVELSYLGGVPGFTCDSAIQIDVKFMNVGNDSLTQVTIEYGTNYQYSNSISWNGIIKTDEIASQQLPLLPLTSNDTIFNLRLVINPSDQDTLNNSIIKKILTNLDPLYVHLRINTDEYGDETSWNIQDTGSSFILHKGGPYVIAPDTSGYTYDYNLCLYEGCFNFNLYDTQGDGFTSNFWGRGYVLITGPYGDTLLYEANFTGSQKTIQFCVNDTSTYLVENHIEKQVKLFPNPIRSGDRLSLDLQSKEDLDIQLIDIQGRVVLREESTQFIIPSSLRNGMYILEIRDRDGLMAVEKLLIQ